MKTYLVKGDMKEFKSFIINNLKHLGSDAIGCMYKDNDIYIRYTKEEVKKIISEQYQITLVDQPKNFLDEDRGWGYFGNEHLFELKL